MREVINILLVILPVIVLFMLIRFFSDMLRHPTRIVAENNGKKKISTNPSYLKKSAYTEYYYDNSYLYEVTDSMTNEIELNKIIKIKPTFTKVNNRRKWSIIYLKAGQEKEVQFYHNLTFANQNFADFLITVKRANPDAEVKKLSFLNI
ncbi:hypothetical protein [Pseudescherichia sp.]|uniref:hypothetical protein n=1 Tax=Pseudescherichia sp. TaxID=2055881 RepID=UPI0028A9C00E|nr:hypothetical protein [Pseudescherichia sp.]